ncbi:AraC-like DNA-binding protein [Leucobacter exalbidus]|uniref:AraC-like DNA-binding protein n=1 Tax=Leucobacter exalbidus TaxID=662960 RepID=A0A940T3T9_9MICO|nr:helix-turn-helix domain-containing protein [Leucobacter exalbidus]MBP1326129.1 AraC-like DNA-binding protein [Leucobacter exalbidus]
MRQNVVFQSYLAAANISFREIDASTGLAARIVQFPQLTVARARLPKSTIEWPRDAMSLDRGLILIAPHNKFSIEGEGPIWRAAPGLFFVPPGDSFITFRATEPIEDLVYINASTSVIRGLVLPKWRGEQHPGDVSGEALAPLLAFVNSLCETTLEDMAQVVPLQLVAGEVFRALVQLVTKEAASSMTTFDFAMQVIKREYSKPHLVVTDIAGAVNVSERTLHSAFAERDTTVMTELRVMRARAAEEIRKRNPGITRNDLAKAAGFGSISSMVRAMKEPSASEV